MIPYAFDLLARAYENRLLEPIVKRMRTLLYCNPDYAFEFLDRLLFMRGKNTIDLLLGCPEPHTRYLMMQLLSETFSTIIDFHNLSLVGLSDKKRDK